MFSHPGKKLKFFAILAFWAVVVICVLAAIILSTVADKTGMIGEYPVWIWYIALGVVVFGTYMSSLFVVAFGELVENSRKSGAKKEEGDPMMTREEFLHGGKD